MDFSEKRKTKNEASGFNSLSKTQRNIITTSCIIAGLIAVLGIILVSITINDFDYRTVLGIVFVIVGASAYFGVTILWIYWSRKIHKDSQYI